MAAPLRILVADDHAIVRQGLKLLIDSQPDMEVVAEAADGKAALELAVEVKPDIVVMDISMPGMNGLIATRSLKQQQPNITIVALTRHEDDTYLEELLRAGASAYVLKQSAPADLLKAIRAVAAGGIYLDPAMTSRVADGLLAEQLTSPPRRARSSPNVNPRCSVWLPWATATSRSRLGWTSASRPSRCTRPTRCGSWD